MIYGGYDHDKFFVDATFGYTNTKYDEHKSVYDKDVSANYTADSLNASLKGGVKVKASEEVTIKPTLAVKNYNIKRNGYTDSLDQKVDNQDMTIVTTEIGADLLYKDKSVETNFGLYYGYDVKTDDELYNVDILNGSSYKANTTKLGKHSGTVDVGINYKSPDNVKVGLGYEGNFKKDYINHSAKFELEVNF
jgi:outer membrane autotransporter protein